MNRRIVCGLMLSTLFATATVLAGGPEVIVPEPINYFSGIFVGGTAAWHHAALNEDSSVVVSSDIPLTVGPLSSTIPAGTFQSVDASGSPYDGYFGAQGGIGKVFGRQFYLGVVGFGEWGSQSNATTVTSNIATPVTFTGTVLNTNVTSQVITKITNDYGVALKPGILVGPRTMLYAKVGAMWGNVIVKNSVNANSSGTVGADAVTVNAAGFTSAQDSGKVALLLGGGFEQFIYTNRISLNVEYNYANFGSVDAGPINLAVTETVNGSAGSANGTTQPIATSASGSAKVSTLLGGLNVYFGSNWF